MAKKTKRAKSAAARKGWTTRRKHEAAEFRRRSRASKKGWRRHKAKERIKEEAKAQPKAKKGRLREWIVTWMYTPAHKGSRPRRVDFTVIARSKEDAELFVIKAVAAGRDSTGTDLTWMIRIPWDEVFTMSPKEAGEDEQAFDKKAIKAAGEGWVEVR